MDNQKSLVSITIFLALCFAVFGAQARAATPSFTVSATSVTMSSSGKSGTGTTTFTLTSVNGYTGTVGISCFPTSEPAGAKLPFCGGSLPPIGYTLKADAVMTGSLPFYNEPVPATPAATQSLRQRLGATGLLLAGAFLLGFGFHRKAARWLVLVLLAVGTLTGLASISGCGGSNSVVTPGTYSYTIQGLDTNSVIVKSTFDVTVP